MNRKNFFSTYTGIIVTVNVVAFLLYYIFSAIFGEFNIIDFIALKPSTVFEYPWTILTSMFMHANFSHLLMNMISLVFIGNFVEKLIGKKRYLYLYFIGGIFASLLFVSIAALTGVDFNVYAVGASGAIFALGGLLAVLTPKLPVMVFFIIPLPMWAAMALLMFGIWAVSAGLGLPIGNIAHLGGLLVGLSYGFYLKKKFPHRTKMISRYFSR